LEASSFQNPPDDYDTAAQHIATFLQLEQRLSAAAVPCSSLLNIRVSKAADTSTS
jgi:hypothetical protein